MSVTAAQLAKSGARGKDLDNVVHEQLQIIDNVLLRTPRSWGRNVVPHDLPTVFNIPGLNKKDAQRIVYSSILKSLDRRGYETKILLEPDKTRIFIAWMTDLDVDEVEAMNALISSKRIWSDAVTKFCELGATPAPRAVTTVRQGRAAPPAPMRVAAKDVEMHPREGLVIGRSPETRAKPAAMSPAEVALLREGK
jgi:hypothetical protein